MNVSDGCLTNVALVGTFFSTTSSSDAEVDAVAKVFDVSRLYRVSGTNNTTAMKLIAVARSIQVLDDKSTEIHTSEDHRDPFVPSPPQIMDDKTTDEWA
jgi:hypothetical protein